MPPEGGIPFWMGRRSVSRAVGSFRFKRDGRAFRFKRSAEWNVDGSFPALCQVVARSLPLGIRACNFARGLFAFVRWCIQVG